MNFLTTTLTIWQRELRRYTRDRGRIMTTLIQPLMFLTIFGFGFQRVFAEGNFGVDYLQFMFPGIIAMNVMGTTFFSTISTVWDREFGFLKEILVAPIPRSGIASGKALGAATIASLQGLLLFLLIPVVGVHVSIGMFPQLFLIMTCIALAIAGMGLFVASLLRSIENFGLIMNLLVFPMFFLSGAFFPLTSVPGWMSAISKTNPLSYGVDALRQIMLGQSVGADALSRFALHSPMTDVLFLLVFAAVMLALSIRAFSRME